jgi:hypothetical protein
MPFRMFISREKLRLREKTSGWRDLNPRPVAAATAMACLEDRGKHQIPTSKLQRNTNLQAPKDRSRCFENCDLELWMLELGIWNLFIGLAGFEPTACRRGDRSTGLGGQVHRGHVLSCNNVLFLWLRRESKSSRCVKESTGLRVAWL